MQSLGKIQGKLRLQLRNNCISYGIHNPLRMRYSIQGLLLGYSIRYLYMNSSLMNLKKNDSKLSLTGKAASHWQYKFRIFSDIKNRQTLEDYDAPAGVSFRRVPRAGSTYTKKKHTFRCALVEHSGLEPLTSTLPVWHSRELPWYTAENAVCHGLFLCFKPLKTPEYLAFLMKYDWLTASRNQHSKIQFFKHRKPGICRTASVLPLLL